MRLIHENSFRSLSIASWCRKLEGNVFPRYSYRGHFSVLLQVIEGNSNTYLGSKRELDPPVWASKIRFLPYSYHRRTVCMRVEIYGCYWNGRFQLIHCVLTSRISLFLDILLRNFSQLVVWKCQRIIWCLTVSERKLIFHSLKERAGIAQYQRGNWYFIVSITSWHHSLSAQRARLQPYSALTIVYDLLQSSSFLVLCPSQLLWNFVSRQPELVLFAHKGRHLIFWARWKQLFIVTQNSLRIALSKESTRLGAFLYLKTEVKPASETLYCFKTGRWRKSSERSSLQWRSWYTP